MSRRRRDADPEIGVHGGLEQRLLGRLKRLRLPVGSRILVGFSGGADSLALAASLASVAPLVEATVELLHVDHGLRDSSQDEARHAIEIAHMLGLVCHVRRIDELLLRAHAGAGIEEAARRERYRLFSEELVKRNGAVIALAHHQSDQAETVLLHLLRGSGVHGASAMKEIVELTVPWWEVTDATAPVQVVIWRPFLAEARDVVRVYAGRTGLDHNEDASNADSLFRRNAIRQEVMPTLERVSPGATAALARYADLAAQADDLLTSLANETIKDALEDDNRLQLTVLRRAHVAVQRTAVHRWLTTADIKPTAERIDAVLHLMSHPRRRRRIEVGGGWCVGAIDARLVLGRCHDEWK